MSVTPLDGHWASESLGEGHVVFNAEGIHCGNCARSIRKAVGDLEGVRRVEVNVVNNRVSVDWDTSKLSLGRILGQVSALGFKPVPLVGEAAARAQQAERRLALKRIGLAALGSMQLMMYTVALYAGALQGIDDRIAEYLRWTCFVITTPVLFYSGAPILRGALADLRRRVLGMDVTVSLALLLAYFASSWNTLRDTGEVYFDSVAMFILLLLIGRFVEMRGRHQAAQVSDALAKALPATAQRIRREDGVAERVPLAALQLGDLLRVNTGQVIPVDGILESDGALIDESLLSGESLPQRHVKADAIAGGAVNAGSALTLRVSRLPGESTLHELVRLLERAQSERPRLGVAAERMASRFVVRILLVTVVVGAIWQLIDPARAFPAMLAVLVATCPCALSLATPAAIAAASSRLARLGVLVMRADAVEGLATVDTVMLDKTGTLTVGSPRITRIDTSDGWNATEALCTAAALEAGSQHPLALAFREHQHAAWRCDDAREIAGQGIEGTVNGQRWRIGQPGITLTGDCGRSASFTVDDPLREDARAATAALTALGLRLVLLSGDRHEAVQDVADTLGISTAHAGLRPADKLQHLRDAQAAGHRVLMLGDGINDGPVLAAANVSMAMGRGSSIAHAAGDLLLLRESLQSLPEAVRVARRTLQIVQQNLRWALIYNLAAVPVAALGFMPPWVAAIGMSASSLLVVINARRAGYEPAGGSFQ